MSLNLGRYSPDVLALERATDIYNTPPAAESTRTARGSEPITKLWVRTETHSAEPRTTSGITNGYSGAEVLRYGRDSVRPINLEKTTLVRADAQPRDSESMYQVIARNENLHPLFSSIERRDNPKLRKTTFRGRGNTMSQNVKKTVIHKLASAEEIKAVSLNMKRDLQALYLGSFKQSKDAEHIHHGMNYSQPKLPSITSWGPRTR